MTLITLLIAKLFASVVSPLPLKLIYPYLSNQTQRMRINSNFSDRTDTEFGVPCRSSHERCSVRKCVLRNFTKFTGKHLCQSLFFNKVAGLRLVTVLKKRLRHRCFPVSLVKFLRTSFLHRLATASDPRVLFQDHFYVISI